MPVGGSWTAGEGQDSDSAMIPADLRPVPAMHAKSMPLMGEEGVVVVVVVVEQAHRYVSDALAEMVVVVVDCSRSYLDCR